MKEKIYLTKLAPNCGCAAKVGPGTLAGVLCKLPKFQNPDLLVGTETSDDAAVYRISDELAMIQTLDFFTPVADDPYDFGQIAAANALSDVYAMGGEPKTALNIVAFPKNMDVEILGEILKGGADKVLEAGAVLAGGHTIQDDTPKYGLSVTGFVHPDKFWKNYGAETGDKLILTKALGVGIINTAIKADMASEKAREAGQNPVDALPEVGGVFEALKSNLPQYKIDNDTVGIGSTIFAVKPGDGSAREQAASCQKVLGGWANIACEYATKRYRSNLINWGMLPFIYESEELPFKNGDYIFVPEIVEAVKNKATDVQAYVVDDDKNVKPFILKLGEMTDDERDIILKG